mmetsp:Transcript_43582/g.93880  ORF Transcript_43582/g.93880 Transcript_43582/m.93880 type:complete len:256 (-) Transcript_43582:482-1249(-)
MFPHDVTRLSSLLHLEAVNWNRWISNWEFGKSWPREEAATEPLTALLLQVPRPEARPPLQTPLLILDPAESYHHHTRTLQTVRTFATSSCCIQCCLDGLKLRLQLFHLLVCRLELCHGFSDFFDPVQLRPELLRVPADHDFDYLGVGLSLDGMLAKELGDFLLIGCQGRQTFHHDCKIGWGGRVCINTLVHEHEDLVREEHYHTDDNYQRCVDRGDPRVRGLASPEVAWTQKCHIQRFLLIRTARPRMRCCIAPP